MRAVKLGALVRDNWGNEPAGALEPSVLPGGAALVGDGGVTRGWVLIDDGVVSRFGAALAWAWRRGVDELHVLVQESVPGAAGVAGAAGVIARRAAEFAPAPTVWTVDGRTLTRAAVAPPMADPGVGPADRRLITLLEDHGAEPTWEHGVLRGEVLGLEVARVIDSRLVVGVGRHDRDARADMHPGEAVGAALDQAVAAVRSRRVAGAASHPANTLARSRWLRSVICAQPSLVGMTSLRPLAPPMPWFDLPEAGAAPCIGAAPIGGGAMVFVCSVGVDLDLVPTAADCRVLQGSGSSTGLELVLAEGDDLPITRALAQSLSRPAGIRVVPRDWERLTSEPSVST